MIEGDRDQNADTRQVHMDNLYRVVQYCENHTECRRSQVLHYFGETDFDPAECRRASGTTCDNCQGALPCNSVDVGDEAKALVETVDFIVHKGNRNWRRPVCKYTLNHVVNIFKGSVCARVTQEGHNSCPHFGKGKDYHRNDAERLARMLVLKNVLAEDMVIGNHDNVICYVKLGPKAIDLLQGRYKLPPLQVREKVTTASSKGKRKTAAAAVEEGRVGDSDAGFVSADVEMMSEGQSHYFDEERTSTVAGHNPRQRQNKRRNGSSAVQQAKKSLQKYRRQKTSGQGRGRAANSSNGSNRSNRSSGSALKLMAPPKPKSRQT